MKYKNRNIELMFRHQPQAVKRQSLNINMKPLLKIITCLNVKIFFEKNGFENCVD